MPDVVFVLRDPDGLSSEQFWVYIRSFNSSRVYMMRFDFAFAFSVACIGRFGFVLIPLNDLSNRLEILVKLVGAVLVVPFDGGSEKSG